MTFTVADVLELRVLRACRLVAGHSQVRQRQVRWVSMIEVPVENFVRRDEFVLSIGVGIGDDADLLVQFVRDVADSGASALGIASGKYVHMIPAAAIDAADEHGLPLIELLPWELPFSEITEAVLRRLINEQHALLLQSLSVHQELMGLILSGASLVGLIKTVARILCRPVVLLDSSGVALARGGLLGDDLDGRAQAALDGVLRRSARGEATLVQTVPGLDVAIVPVQAAQQVRGYLATSLVGNPLSEIERLTIEHASTAAAICFLQQLAAQEAEMRLRDDFVWSLATGNVQLAEHTVARGRLLGYDVTCPYAGIFGQFEMAEGSAPGDTVAIARQILGIAEGMAAEMRRRLMATFTSGSLILFLGVEPPGSGVEDFVQRVAERVAKAQPGLTISWGVGDARTGLKNFQHTYQDAREACAVGVRIKGPGHIGYAAQAGIYRTLLKVCRDHDARKFCDRHLSPLVAYDQTKGGGLLHTLEVYLETQGNVSEAARRLHLHRQSLLYRLERIEQLTGCSLAEPQDRFTLELSLRLHRIGEATNGIE